MPSAAFIPFGATWHLRAELSRLLVLLEEFLLQQRDRGRSRAGDVVKGLVIEDGEAEGLISNLMSEWATDTAQRTPSLHSRAQRDKTAQIADRAAAQGAYLPLLQAVRAFELGLVEYQALLLALAAEVDARFGRLFAYLNDHVGQTRPTLGLAIGLCALDGGVRDSYPPAIVEHPLVQDGLAMLEGDGPIPGRALRLSDEIAQRLTHDEPLEPRADGVEFEPVEIGLLDRLVLTESVREALKLWTDQAREPLNKAPRLMLIGDSGSGRSTLARAAASVSGRPLVSVEIPANKMEQALLVARREQRWYNAALLLKVDAPDIQWRTVWSGLDTVSRPVIVALSRDAIEKATQNAPAEINSITLPEPDAALRTRLWQVLTPPGIESDSGTAETLASAFRFGPGKIAQVMRRAETTLSLEPPGKRRLTKELLKRTAREVGNAQMGTLAQKLPCPYEPDDLVVPSNVKEELDLALSWVLGQQKVLSDWGFARRVPFGWGLKALFSGPSGTGKTMAVQILARQLDLDLYRVDLSQTVSKYIGETEKNLARLFDEAHKSGAVLFFDEADALFGKRSEVKDAHDRYANIEIGYLLQRMEEHDGIVVLATNRHQDMDEAFTRRFDVMADFPMPDESHRLQIWQNMFPADAERGDLDLELLARTFELSGGEIRNAVIAAAYIAASERRSIGMEQLMRALRRELMKSGRVIDEAELRLLP